jgi:glycosyltransferase involved in cell wall biosynthesis
VYAVTALSHVLDEYSEVTLLLIGDGSLRSKLEAAARDEGIADRVAFIGHVADVTPYYAAADVFVLPSETEGLPVVTLEAMAASLPVVATDIPGVNKVVVDRGTGRLVPPGDVKAFASAMVECVNPDTRDTFGIAGNRRVSETFSIDTVTAAYVNLYH